MNRSLIVENIDISFFSREEADFISLTDIAKYRNQEAPRDVIKNWIRLKSTLEFLSFWEKINNPDFKQVEFDRFWQEAGTNVFVLSPSKWIVKTRAVGLIANSGQGGGTYAHKDIAFEFASWISAEFKLYLIKEFQRLKEAENKNLKLDWSAKRMLTKINYKIHTDAIKEHIIPKVLNKKQINSAYANEADVLNVALFQMTAKQWRKINPNRKGNIRDYADIKQLVCLANLESLNAEFIRQNLSQTKRLKKLNQIAIIQMTSLIGNESVKKLN